MQAGDRDRAGAGPVGGEGAVEFVVAAGFDAGAQQGELDDVVLGAAAAAHAVGLAEQRREVGDGSRVVAADEGGEAAGGFGAEAAAIIPGRSR